MDDLKQEGERALRGGLNFTWIAALVIVAIGILWLIAGAMSHPSHKADATSVGNRAETTPAIPTNGGDVASVSEGTAPASPAAP